MKLLSRISILLVLACLAGCATLNRADSEYLVSHHVPPMLYDRMLRHEPLTLTEIIVLSDHRVSSGFIIHYVRSTLAVYRLGSDDVLRLKKANVSRDVIDYLLATPSMEPRPYVYGGWYFGEPYYGGPVPYPYPFYGPTVIVSGGHRWHRW